MNQPKVSIIVPVHNAGQYFEKCLGSLVGQTLREIEIILVLDCPSDGSNKLAESFASEDSRIKLIYNTENLHTGLSRNKGLQAAKGKYIGFQDHDDYCEPDMYENLYQKADSENLEVVRCNFRCVYTSRSGYRVEDYFYPDLSTNISNRDWVYEYVSSDSISCVIWNHLYKADFLKQHHLTFLDSRTICSEDSLFFIDVYSKVQKFGSIPHFAYYHVFHASNTGKVYDYRSVKSRITFFEELYDFLQKNGVGESTSLSYLSCNTLRSLYSGSRQVLMQYPFKKAIAEIAYLKNRVFLRKCLDYIYKKENKHLLSKLKPTVKIYSLILRSYV